MSKGSLKIPSDDLFKAVKMFEKYFKQIHQGNLSNEPNIFKKLMNTVKPHIEHLGIPEEVIQCIIRTRTYIRLNNLNRKIKDQQFKKKINEKYKNLPTKN